MSKMANIILSALLVLLVVAAGIVVISGRQNKNSSSQTNLTVKINSYEECVAAGYTILESYPARCLTPDGKSFTQDIGNELEKTDLIQITQPRPNAVITSPLTIKGRARGTWFFEASFPVSLTDNSGNKIASAIASAQGDWMTEDFVEFSATLEFSAPTTTSGTLLLTKDDPSGAANNDELVIPVTFSTNNINK